jgi:hypothetical protein
MTDPANPNATYGKSPYSITGSFLYFNNKNQEYHIASSRYDGFEYAVEAAFQSWNSVCKVQFSHGTGGVTLDANLSASTAGQVNSNDTFNHNTDELTPSTATITLGGGNTWAIGYQNINLNGGGTFDVQAILTHEIGHVLGLSHPEPGTFGQGTTAPTMVELNDNPIFTTDYQDMRSLETADELGSLFSQLRVPNLFTTLSEAIGVADQIGAGYIYITGNYYLSDNIYVGNGERLTIRSGVALNINGYTLIISNNLTSPGSITLESNAAVSGAAAIVKDGSTKLAYFPTIQGGINYASTHGNIVEVPSGSYVLGANITVPTGVTLTISSDAIINLVNGGNRYSIISTGGSIAVNNGATINGLRARLTNPTLRGLCSTIQAAVNYSGSTNEIYLENGNFNENVNIYNKYNLSISGNQNYNPFGSLTVTSCIAFEAMGFGAKNIYISNSSYLVLYGLNAYGTDQSTVGFYLYNSDTYDVSYLTSEYSRLGIS